ncbi:uncharacterized protein AB9X84_003700 [Acanthopagrus schlegelii]
MFTPQLQRAPREQQSHFHSSPVGGASALQLTDSRHFSEDKEAALARGSQFAAVCCRRIWPLPTCGTTLTRLSLSLKGLEDSEDVGYTSGMGPPAHITSWSDHVKTDSPYNLPLQQVEPH